MKVREMEQTQPNSERYCSPSGEDMKDIILKSRTFVCFGSCCYNRIRILPRLFLSFHLEGCANMSPTMIVHEDPRQYIHHDQLFKQLIHTFFAEFLEMFYPEVH
ncbi:hypothetical protein QF028_004821 [Neobacillus sp. B4I6]